MASMEILIVVGIIALAASFLLRNLWKKMKPSPAKTCGGVCACGIKPSMKKDIP